MTFKQLTEEFHRFFSRNENDKIFLGLWNQPLGDLPSTDVTAIDEDVKDAFRLKKMFSSLETDDFDESLDCQLATMQLDRFIHDKTVAAGGHRSKRQRPSAGDDIGDGLFMMMIRDPRDSGAALSDCLSRLNQVPAYLKAHLEFLESPIARWVEIEQQKIAGLPTLFATLQSWSKDTAFPDGQKLTNAIGRAQDALLEYGRKLTALPANTDFSIGPMETKLVLQNRGIELSTKDLHSIASNFLRQTGQSIEEMRNSLTKKYQLASDTSAADLQKHLCQRFSVSVQNLEDVLDVYQAEREKVLAFIQERDLFPVFDEQDMVIMRTPTFMEASIPAGAMMPPEPFGDGIKKSLVYLTLSEELLDEHTTIGIPTMMIHEGIPGHHLQLATASLHPSIIRRHCSANDMAEGWTTMLEDYMLDQGYAGDLTEEVRFLAKREICRLGARVAIDLFFMTGDKQYLDVGIPVDLSSSDPFECAGALLQTVTGFVPGRVQAELNWYSQERGYPLSYLTGNHLTWKLKGEMETHTGLDSLELDRKFHEAFLNAGNMPMSFLRKLFAKQGLVS